MAGEGAARERSGESSCGITAGCAKVAKIYIKRDIKDTAREH